MPCSAVYIGVIMAEGYIKLYRKMLDWEWYDDPNTCRVFIHILLKASWKESSWHGIKIHPGQLITSLSSLSKELHLSEMQVRTALKKLKSTGDVTEKQQAKCRIITVSNWVAYQDDNRMITGWQQDDNRMITASKEYKNIKNKRIYKRSSKSDTDYDALAEELEG